MIKHAPAQSLNFVHQGILGNFIHEIFKGEDIKTNSRRGSSLVNPITTKFLEIDVWVPDRNICFEFQDDYHYVTTWYSQTPLSIIKKTDYSKKDMIRGMGHTLIDVPCWWDATMDSLQASILFARPDLSDFIPAPNCVPTSLNPPSNYFKNSGVPGIGELMAASFNKDPKFSELVSPSNFWWMGEKYDGVRFCWHVDDKILYSRTSTELPLLPSFYDLFPTLYLDGELWFGRGFFPEAQRIVNAASELVLWEYLRAVSFDVASTDFSHLPFEERYALVLNSVSEEHPFIIIAQRVMSPNYNLIQTTTDLIIQDEGEGVILRKPKSVYEHGRSPYLVKIKSSRGDQEAIVMSVAADKSIVLGLPDGKTTFSVPKTSVEVRPYPKQGDVVTFACDNYSNKAVPVNPRIFRVRIDISWKEVVRKFAEDGNIVGDSLPEKYAVKPTRYWTMEQNKNMRKFFEEYAKGKHLDPLSPETWYRVSRKSIMKKKGGRTILQYLKGGLVSAIIKMFPELKLERSKFDVMTNYWKQIPNRRKFFDKVAKEFKFDPLIGENWYKVTFDNLLFTKGASTLLRIYSDNIVKALEHIYPELDLDPSKFATVPANYWKEVKNRKQFFEDLAKRKGFDPLIPQNWYYASRRAIASSKGIATLLKHYNGSLATALITLYPNIGLEAQYFPTNPGGSKRWMFESFAKSRGLNPMDPESWYSVNTQDLLAFNPNISNILSLYRGSKVKALTAVFPSLKWDLTKFSTVPRSHWMNPDNRLKLMNTFAREKGFNPLIPTNWYSLDTLESFIHSYKGKAMLAYYGGNITKALLHLYPNIGLDVSKFPAKPRKYWHNLDNRRDLFVTFAKKNNFNPHSLDNWLQIPREKLLAVKGTSSVLHFYNGNLTKAFNHLFPAKTKQR